MAITTRGGSSGKLPRGSLFTLLLTKVYAMQKAHTRFTIALLFSAYVVLAYFGTAYLSSAIDFLYRDAAGLSTVRSIAQVAALLAAGGLLVTGLIVAISTALRPFGNGAPCRSCSRRYLMRRVNCL